MRAQAITYQRAEAIMRGPREIPAAITRTVETMLKTDTPMVDVDRFGACLTGMMNDKPGRQERTIAATNYRHVVNLGACSLEMAWQLAGDICIPRPRRLGEHDQSVLNVYDRYLAATCRDPRDRLLKPMFILQDGGKAHCVALTPRTEKRRSRDQAIHNSRVAANVLAPLPATVLAADEKKVIRLLIDQTAIGRALGRHADKGEPLHTVIPEAKQQLNGLRRACPPAYRDRFDHYLLVSFLADAGAHTMRARYTDAATGKVMVDVKHSDRYHPDGTETNMTLDRLFSEAPADRDYLRLYRPAHVAVMRRLFPGHY